MKGFVRFEKMADDVYLSKIAPRNDILPLIRPHFEKRYADQEWIIFDTKRRYGLHFDTKRTTLVHIKDDAPPVFNHDGKPEELTCQTLWRTYFEAINIPERKNPRLHQQNLPRRYWAFLPEKRM